MKEWRMKWSQEAKILGFRLETALLKITQHNERKSNIKTQTIIDLINKATDELVQIYFQK